MLYIWKIRCYKYREQESKIKDRYGSSDDLLIVFIAIFDGAVQLT